MEKRGGKKNGPDCTSSAFHKSLTLREEAAGKKQMSSIKSTLKLQYLQNRALWAAGEASIPFLAAFYGCYFSACGEALGVPPDPSLFPCQRCETILQPGFNCTIRIEKNGAKKRLLDKKPITCTGNNAVYMCHFCFHRNVKKGTPKGHVRESCPSKAKLPLKPEPVKSALERDAMEQGSSSKVKGKKTDNIGPSSPVNIQSTAADSLATPSALLDSKRKRRRRLSSKEPVESEASIIAATAQTDKASGVSRKRRRKSWITLKEIAQNSGRERSQKLNNFSIPFMRVGLQS